MQVVVDGSPLSIADVVAVAHRTATAIASPDLDDRMLPAQTLVQDLVDRGETVYGITTGFGALSNTRIPPDRAVDLQYDLLRSHASGVGPLLEPEVVRAMLVCRARTLAQGHSGVRPDVVRALLALLDHDILPAVPSQGSVGASGDLAPFAHLALPLIGEGEVLAARGTEPAADALVRAGLDPISLGPRRLLPSQPRERPRKREKRHDPDDGARYGELPEQRLGIDLTQPFPHRKPTLALCGHGFTAAAVPIGASESAARQ